MGTTQTSEKVEEMKRQSFTLRAMLNAVEYGYKKKESGYSLDEALLDFAKMMNEGLDNWHS